MGPVHDLHPLPDDAVIAITGIMLDVSEADSGPITVTLDLESADDDLALLIGSDTGDVIAEILLGVKVTAKMDTIRTRGGEADSHVSQLTKDSRVLLRLDGQRMEFEVQRSARSSDDWHGSRRRQ